MNRISIITISFNNPQELINTCKSVDGQVEKPFEHLVIDGSTGTDIRRFLENNPQPAYRRWICEPDDGIADAFNKGVRNAKGDILAMLNSGDCFFDKDSLKKVAEVYQQHPNIQWMHASYQLQRGGKWVIIGKPFSPAKLYRGMRSICHQTMYVRRELFNKYGQFDTSLRIAMDYDFLIRIRKEPFYFLSEPIVVFAPEGVSTVQYLRSLDEATSVYKRYFSNTVLHHLWKLRLKILYYLLHSPLGNVLYGIKTRLKLENM